MIEIGPNQQPLMVFSAWMEDAKAKSGMKEPTAMTLSTVGSDGMPHARVLLCKGWSEDGFVFYTNFESRKGHDLAQNPKAAMVFFWDALARQVNISGNVTKLPRQKSEEYWNSRPRDSQLSQLISHQSEAVESREAIERARTEAEQKFAGRTIPCPEHWGGYILSPTRIEFWVGKPSRLHDRFEFAKSGKLWTFRRLYP